MSIGALADSAAYEAFCSGTLADPYLLLDQLRSVDPVHWSDQLGGWILTRYDDVLAAHLDRRLASARVEINMRAIPAAERDCYSSLEEHVSNWLGFTDPPKHRRMRRLVSKVIAPTLADGLRPRIDDIVDGLLDLIAAVDQADLLSDLAFPLPSTVICEILGIPADSAADFQDHTSKMVRFIGNVGPTLAALAPGAREGHRALDSFFDACLKARRGTPSDDLLTDLANVEEGGEELARNELLGLCSFLYVAGHETTVALIANGIRLLMLHADQAELFRSGWRARANAIEEIMRYESPIQMNTRLAVEDLEMRGKHISAGDTVILHLGAANRDPVRFPEPERFDIRRQDNRHLGFGWATHFCLGAPLARLEAQVALTRLFERFHVTPLEPAEGSWKESMTLRCPGSLPVRVDARAGSTHKHRQ